MIVNRNREKLLNALIFFSENVRYPGKIKLFKLLYFLDFLHYQKTGRSVTGLKYYAWKMGPVPRELNEEWETPRPDFVDYFFRRQEDYGRDRKMQRLIARKKYDESIFSPFELELMQMLSRRHFNHAAEDMTEESHLETFPWHEIWEVQNKKNEEIPYELVLFRRDSSEDREVQEMAKEYEALHRYYS